MKTWKELTPAERGVIRLQHFSPEPLIAVNPRRQEPKALRGRFDKPRGLWVSDEAEYGWLKWTTDEDHRGGLRGELCHGVELARDANVLVLRSAEDIDGFTERFGLSFEQCYGTAPSCSFQSLYRVGHGIDWRAVAKEWDGILITPYVWERRLHVETSWYYAWDCASGCIWRPKAIASVQEVKRVA